MTEPSLRYYRWIIACRVRSARERRRMTTEELARQAAITASQLADAEVGTESLTIDELERIAVTLRVPLAHFIGPCVLCGSPD